MLKSRKGLLWKVSRASMLIGQMVASPRMSAGRRMIAGSREPPLATTLVHEPSVCKVWFAGVNMFPRIGPGPNCP